MNLIDRMLQDRPRLFVFSPSDYCYQQRSCSIVRNGPPAGRNTYQGGVPLPPALWKQVAGSSKTTDLWVMLRIPCNLATANWGKIGIA